MVAKAGEGLDELESLLASGKIPENADVTDIAALLQDPAAAAAPSKDDAAAGADAKAGDGAAASGSEPAKAGDGEPAKAAAAPAQDDKDSGAPSGTAQGSQEHEGPIVTPSGKTMPFSVLKGTREQLAKATENLNRLKADNEAKDQELARLRQQLAAGGSRAADATQTVQDAADAAGIKDALGRPVDVATIDVESLRGEFPEPVVNAIAALQTAASQLAQQNQQLTQEVRTLKSNDAARGQREALSEEDQLQADIDSIPTLAQWAASQDPKMFDRAIAMDAQLRRESEWTDRPRVERFQEVVRLLGGDPSLAPDAAETSAPGAKAPATTTDPKQVAAALERASARAAPHTHSDLPAGSPAAQSELEGLESMDVTQVAEKFGRMTKAEQDRLLERLG